jgi:hypothetical protein
MTLLHGRWARRTSLLAAGVLEGGERAATLAHLEGCAACRAELQAARDLIALALRDPVRTARPPLPAALLLARVRARLDATEPARPPQARRWAATLLPLAAAAAIALVLLRSPGTRPPVPASPAPPRASVSEEALRRLETSVARENAVRYLSEAQDVLVTVAAAPPACDRRRKRIDVEDEARRSRELLSRRAFLVETDRAEMAGARPVLEDVSDMLREVAALEACSRPEDLLAIQQQMSRQRLLMKIDLMTRELQG